MASDGFTEAQLRDWLNENLEDFVWKIGNLEAMEKELEDRVRAFQGRRWESDSELIEQALQAVLAKRFLDSLLALRSCASFATLGKERALIDSDLPGRDPSADILAVAEEAGAFMLVEVKISASAARQSITELSAYSNGLASRFWGLSAYDSIWVLVSTVYRPTVAAAIVYQQLLASRCVVPLCATVSTEDGRISEVKLQVEDLSRYAVLPATVSDALFSCSVYELHAAHFSKPVPDGVLHFLSSEYVGRGAIGFCFRRHPSPAESKSMPYPHGVAAAMLNPFKLHHKARQLAIIAESPDSPRGSAAYASFIGQDCFDEHDIDLTTWDDHWKESMRDDDYEESDVDLPVAHSLFELSIREMASQLRAFDSVMDYIRDLGPNAAGAWTEVGGADFGGSFFPCLGVPHYRQSNTTDVRYFGILHDIVAQISKNVVHNDPEFSLMTVLEAYESPKLLYRLLRSMNPRPA